MTGVIYGETFSFLRPSEVVPEPGEQVCRAARLGGFFMFGVLAAMTAVPFYIWWTEDILWIFDILLGLWAALFLLVTYMAFRSATAAWGPKNWLLRIRADGVMIKFRSYLNAEKDADDETVVFIHFREIASVNAMKQRHIQPGGSHGEVTLGKQSLEFILRDPDHAAALARRIVEERKHFEQKRTARAQFRHWPVDVVASETGSDMVRLAWRGRSDRISPGIKTVMKILSHRLRTSETDQGTVRILDLPPEARDERIRQMVRGGDRVTAVKIISKSTGMGLTEAIEYVDALAKDQPDAPENSDS